MSRTSSGTATQPAKSAQPAPSSQPAKTGSTVSLEKVAKRAYEKWLKEGCMHGCDQKHWYEAEAELRAEMTKGGKK
jgi:hypothetical protein